MVALISRLGACVPVYDFHTARKYAELLLNAQIILCACGALSWAFGGVASLTFGFALLAHVGLEVAKPRLLKMYTVSQFALLLWDVIWLSLWARRIDRGAVRARIFRDTTAELPQTMRSARARRGVCADSREDNLFRRLSDPLARLLLLPRPLDTGWHLRQRALPRNAQVPAGHAGPAVPLAPARHHAVVQNVGFGLRRRRRGEPVRPDGGRDARPPPAAPPAGGAGYAGGGDGYKPYGVPDGNPSLGQGGGAYVPPAAAQQ